jgi:hypothetical protein
MGILGEMPNLLVVVAWVPHWSGQLWWPGCHQLLRCRRSLTKLLCLLLLVVVVVLEQWAVAIELLRTV